MTRKYGVAPKDRTFNTEWFPTKEEAVDRLEELTDFELVATDEDVSVVS